MAARKIIIPSAKLLSSRSLHLVACLLSYVRRACVHWLWALLAAFFSLGRLCGRPRVCLTNLPPRPPLLCVGRRPAWLPTEFRDPSRVHADKAQRHPELTDDLLEADRYKYGAYALANAYAHRFFTIAIAGCAKASS